MTIYSTTGWVILALLLTNQKIILLKNLLNKNIEVDRTMTPLENIKKLRGGQNLNLIKKKSRKSEDAIMPTLN